MKHKIQFLIVAVPLSAVLFLSFTLKNPTGSLKLSPETEECISCHESVTPGIVSDWKSSLHSLSTINLALSKPEIERRISGQNKNIDGDIAIGCFECHSLNAENHKDNFEHFGYNINVIVSPADCAGCHPEEEKQYSGSKKAHALGNLQKNPVYSLLVETITGVHEYSGAKLVNTGSSAFTKNETCYACHGTDVEVKGLKKIETVLGEIEVPDLTNWPNQGVGRINPDGSKGSCTACHPRHSFSIEVARKPYTCGQCHLEPDVPAYNVYKESKHGNIFDSQKEKWNWSEVPWEIGTDFKAPTCASCHNSLLVNSSGEVIAERSHDFSSRLWVRIFGLPYSHPQPVNGYTHEIKNKDGLPLPTSFDGTLASSFLIDENEQSIRKSRMTAVCNSCHSQNWIDGFFEKFDNTVKETDKAVLESTKMMADAWEKGIADNSNPFDEFIEKKWIEQWLFYANSIRYGSAMAGPDYAAFKNGWWDFNKSMQQMNEFILLHGTIKKTK